MRAAPLAALALALAGCSARTGAPESFAAATAPSDAQAMATDALAELTKLYPPAISRVSVGPVSEGDSFGRALAAGLRTRGYAVVEFAHKPKADPAALPLRYVVDQPMPGFYRVMLAVGAQSLSRGYALGEGGVTPMAGWALNLSGASAELVERATRPELPGNAEQLRAELAAVDAGLAPPRALVTTNVPQRRVAVSPAANGAAVDRAFVASDPVQTGLRTRNAELAASQAQLARMTAKVAEYRAADADVRSSAAKVAKYQAELALAKTRRAAAAAGWRVQFAAFRNDRNARAYWRSLTTARPTLAALSPRFPRSSHGVTFVQAGPYRTIAFARAVCGGLRASACIVVKA